MSLFLSPEDYVLYKKKEDVEEISFVIDKKQYSLWTLKSNKPLINEITEQIELTLKKTQSKFEDLSKDYIFIISVLEIITELTKENQYIKNNLSQIRMKNDFYKQSDLFLEQDKSLEVKEVKKEMNEIFLEILTAIKDKLKNSLSPNKD